MDNLNASKFLIGSDEQDPFNYDDMHQEEIRQELDKPTLEDDVFVSEEEKEEATSSKLEESEDSEGETSNDMGGNSIMILALLIGAFLFMRKK
jgi:hypothetical protein